MTVLLLAGLGLAILFWPVPVGAASARTLRIEARQYAYSPSVIAVNPGDTVTIELVSSDVVHGIYVDGYGLSVEADPGQTARLTFVADRPGSFRLRCNVTCGAMHPFMIARLHVGVNHWFMRGASLSMLALAAVLAFSPQKQPTG